jgi:hypothetical protein
VFNLVFIDYEMSMCECVGRGGTFLIKKKLPITHRDVFFSIAREKEILSSLVSPIEK